MIEDDGACILKKAKEFVLAGKRHFVIRRERNYRQDLFDLGLGSSMDKVWEVICQLETVDMMKERELDENGSGEWVYFYQKDMPNGTTAYIKLKVDERRGCVCISFHPVEYGENAINRTGR